MGLVHHLTFLGHGVILVFGGEKEEEYKEEYLNLLHQHWQGFFFPFLLGMMVFSAGIKE